MRSNNQTFTPFCDKEFCKRIIFHSKNRKSRPWKLRQSRIDRASGNQVSNEPETTKVSQDIVSSPDVENQSLDLQDSDDDGTSSDEESSVDSSMESDSYETSSDEETTSDDSSHSDVTTSGDSSDSTSDSNSDISSSECSSSEEDESIAAEKTKTDQPFRLAKKQRQKRHRFSLHWTFRILAWLLCLSAAGASIFFVWAYGVSFGNDKTYQWLVSVLSGIAFDALVVEPFKVMMISTDPVMLHEKQKTQS